jgi:hypothetical protein
MNRFKKKIFIWLIVLAVCSPVGLLLPQFFHADRAWGEWDVGSIGEKKGYLPEGMAKRAAIWKSPIPDYKMKEKATLPEQSFHYIISGIVGITFALLITYGLTKLLVRHEKTP